MILDAKRGDIGSTATHYGQLAFGGAPDLDGGPLPGIGADWMTVNGYLGIDGVGPVLDAGVRADHGVFVLVKTSNPSSGRPAGRANRRRAHREPSAWPTWCTSGARPGSATAGSATSARWWARPTPTTPPLCADRMPDTVFLVPGYGAQGASAADALAGLRPDGRGVIVSSSRGITGAWHAAGTEDVGAAARDALDAMNDDLDAARP